MPIEEDEPNILGTAAVVGTAVAGTAILAWCYQLGTELYPETALPAGTAIPTTVPSWPAVKSAPASPHRSSARRCHRYPEGHGSGCGNHLLKAAKDNGETYVDTGFREPC